MNFKEIADVIYKRLWLLILIPIISGGIMSFFSLKTYVPLYEARTTLYVMNSGSSRQGSGMQADIEIARVLVNDYSELIKSKLITSTIVDQLDLKGINPEDLSNRISASAKEGTRVIVISAIDQSPETARDIANMTGEVFAEKAIELMRVDTVATIDKASTPTYPINAKSYKNVIIAAFFGVVVAITIMLFLEYIDDTIKTREDLEKNLGIRVLGIIPVFTIR